MGLYPAAVPFQLRPLRSRSAPDDSDPRDVLTPEVVEFLQSLTVDDRSTALKDAAESGVFWAAQFLPQGGQAPLTSPASAISKPFRDIPAPLAPDRYFATRLRGLVGAAAVQAASLLTEAKYVGPLRGYPERHYVYTGSAGEHVGKLGQLAPEIFSQHRAELEAPLNRALKAFGTPYTIRIAEADTKDSAFEGVYAVRLIDGEAGVDVALLDVGFGLSQVLPVLVQAYLSRQSLIIVEQPEIHLHPKIQAEFGDVLAECIEEGRENRFIIETHSEHLLLRVRRLIREGRLRADQVSVVFVERIGGNTNIRSIRLGDDGRMVDHWPRGFFDLEFREVW